MVTSIGGNSSNTASRLFGWFEIDQSPCRASYGIKSTFAWTLDLSAAGKRQAMEYISKVADEGDRKANIASKENAIANIATEHSRPRENGQLVWARIDRPVIDYHPSARFIVDI